MSKTDDDKAKFGPPVSNNDEFYSKAEPEKEASIVEKVFSERNLVTVDNDVIKNMPGLTTVSKTDAGTVRIEGDVTNEKMALARGFERIFAEASGEVLELASYKPKQEIMDMVDSGEITKTQVNQFKGAQPYTLFKGKFDGYMKTPDNKIEKVRDYCFRLEKAVLAQVQMRKQVEKAKDDTIKFLQEQINTSEKEAGAYKRAINDLKKSPQEEGRALINLDLGNIVNASASFFLRLGNIFAKLKATVLNHLGE